MTLRPIRDPGPISSQIRQYGFSLIELLVAMVVFAMVGLIAQEGLVTTLRGAERLTARAETLAELQVAVSRITRDLEAAAARPFRSAAGPGVAKSQPFVLGRGGKTLRFVRTAPPDPSGRALGGFRRIAYGPAATTAEGEEDGGGRVQRVEWRSADAPPAPPDRTALLSPQIADLRFEVLGQDGWTDRWPPPQPSPPLPNAGPGPGPGPSGLLPRAVAIEITTRRWGPLRRIVALQ